ncbi:DUF1525 domain-containing protein [Photorhabdus viridis]
MQSYRVVVQAWQLGVRKYPAVVLPPRWRLIFSAH